MNLRGTAFAPHPQQKIFFLISSQDPKIIQSFALGQIWFIYLYLIPLAHRERTIKTEVQGTIETEMLCLYISFL